MAEPNIKLTRANWRLLHQAAANEAYAAWNRTTDISGDIKNYFEGVFQNEHLKLSHDNSESHKDTKKSFFHALRLFATCGKKYLKEDPKGHIKVDVYSTFANFLSLVWFSGDISPVFAGNGVSVVNYRVRDLYTEGLILSASLYLQLRSPLPAFLDRFFTASMRKAKLVKTIWDGSQIEGQFFVRCILNESFFRRTTIIKSYFDDSFMSDVSFETASDAPPEPPVKRDDVISVDSVMRDKGATAPDDVSEIGFDSLGLPSEDETPAGVAGDEGAKTSVDVEIAEPVDGESQTQEMTPEAYLTTERDLRTRPGELDLGKAKDDEEARHKTVFAPLKVPANKPVAALHAKESKKPGSSEPADDGPATSHDVPQVTTIIIDSFFRRVRSRRINFSNVILENVSFERSLLLKAKFIGSHLTDIDFTDSDLTDASFEGADFKGKITFSKKTKITLEQLIQAKDAEVAIIEWHRVFGNKDDASGKAAPGGPSGGGTPRPQVPIPGPSNGTGFSRMPTSYVQAMFDTSAQAMPMIHPLSLISYRPALNPMM